MSRTPVNPAFLPLEETMTCVALRLPETNPERVSAVERCLKHHKIAYQTFPGHIILPHWDKMWTSYSFPLELANYQFEVQADERTVKTGDGHIVAQTVASEKGEKLIPFQIPDRNRFNRPVARFSTPTLVVATAKRGERNPRVQVMQLTLKHTPNEVQLQNKCLWEGIPQPEHWICECGFVSLTRKFMTHVRFSHEICPANRRRSYPQEPSGNLAFLHEVAMAAKKRADCGRFPNDEPSDWCLHLHYAEVGELAHNASHPSPAT